MTYISFFTGQLLFKYLVVVRLEERDYPEHLHVVFFIFNKCSL